MATKIVRLSVVEQIHYQTSAEQPTSITTRFSRSLESEDPPYQYVTLCTNEYQEINKGWVKKPGTLIIINEEGKNRQKILSEAEKADTKEMVLEVTRLSKDGELSNITLLVYPTESLRFSPTEFDETPETEKGWKWVIRTRHPEKKVKATITVVTV